MKLGYAGEEAQASLVMGLMPSLLVVALLAQEISEARSSWVGALNGGLGFGLVTLRLDDVWLELESARLHYRVRRAELTGRVETPRSMLLGVKDPTHARDLGRRAGGVPVVLALSRRGHAAAPRARATRKRG